jgi:hypothetical protein
MALFSLTPLYLGIQRILNWFFASLLALTVFGTVTTLIPKKNGQNAGYSDGPTGKVELARSICKKRGRGVVAGLVLAITFGFTTIGLVVWKCRYDNRSVLWIQLFFSNAGSDSNPNLPRILAPYPEVVPANSDSVPNWEDWAPYSAVAYASFDSVSNWEDWAPYRIVAHASSGWDLGQAMRFWEVEPGRTFVAPSDIWMPSDLELSMMTSTIPQVDSLGFAAPVYVRQIGQDRPAQNQVETDSYDAAIAKQGMSSLMR